MMTQSLSLVSHKKSQGVGGDNLCMCTARWLFLGDVYICASAPRQQAGISRTGTKQESCLRQPS